MKKALVLLCLVSCQWTCAPGLKLHGPPVATDSCPAKGPVLEAMTYNVGLAPGVVSMATPRIKPVAEELAKFREVGVTCIQEAWTQEARDAIVASLALPAENVFYADSRGMGDDLSGINVCSRGQIEPIAKCVRDSCQGVPDEDRTICALAKCRKKLIDLHGLFGGGKNCLNCLVSSVGLHEDEVVRRCTDGKGVSHAYDGQNGVMLISRWPLKNREALLLPSSTANRVALFATVEIDGLEPIELACAHLSTHNELPPSHRGPDGALMFSDWDGEMIAQIDLVAERLTARAGMRPQIFLGDMNAGPDLPDGISPAMPKVWNRLLALGFDSPAARADAPFCSTCAENTLRDSSRSYLIDHVLTRDPKGGTDLEAVCARPVFDQRRVFRGYDGLWVDSHLSDHFGTAVTFRPRAPPRGPSPAFTRPP